MEMARNYKISTYVEQKDYETLKTLADKEKRSVSSLLAIIISAYLEDPSRIEVSSTAQGSTSSENESNTTGTGKGGDEFLIKIASAKRPNAIERAALAHKLNIPVEKLDEIVNRIFDKNGVNNGA